MGAVNTVNTAIGIGIGIRLSGYWSLVVSDAVMYQIVLLYYCIALFCITLVFACVRAHAFHFMN